MVEINITANVNHVARAPSAYDLSRLVFVGGSPRSGTTLAQRILDCHKDIYGGPEFDFVPSVMDLFQTMRTSVRSGRIDSFLDEANLVKTFRNLLGALLLPKLQEKGVSFLSEKTPSNVLAFGLLEECVPECKKILVLRDPRDVVNSMLEVGQRQKRREGRASGFVRDTLAAVEYMNQCLRAGTAVAETSLNCLVIYYEDMVCDPLAVGNRMYRFIGASQMDTLDLENEQFEAARNKESWVDWSTPGTTSGGVRNDRVGVAKRCLKKSDLDYICARTISHPLLSDRYPVPQKRTVAARWCVARCLASRFRENPSPLRDRFVRFLAE